MLHQGSCHCGQIAFEVEGDFTEGLDCNCSLCRRRGGLLAFVPADAFRLKTPENALSTYRFNTRVLQHHFCANCGIAPFSDGQNGEGAATKAINLRCLPDMDLDALKITKWDGAHH
ncbi:GFA family protein [Asticcacaulis sp. 201]|uniref:GFA family protein n=1 Tax=Asticcacaulis sp. 201 TaxID=3028787 RepID=UPI002916894E|nr:GFA family protein [Asticcacaulis sp. 201]MDV6331687.1 GFA family protein [Asticcacaulis sp. 201]